MENPDPLLKNPTNSAENLPKEKYVYGISLNVLLMGLISLFTDVSSEMIAAVMPLFILSIASANAIIALGLIDGISNAVANMIKGVSGWLSDKLKKRKAFVLLGYGISNFTKPFIGLQSSWQAVLGLKVADRVGKGIRVAPRDALISYYADKSLIDSGDTSGKSNSGLNFGIHRTMDTMGAVIGPFLAALLLFVGLNYGQIILWSILPGAVAIIFVIMVKDVHEDDILKVKSQQIMAPKPEKKEKTPSQSQEKMPSNLKRLILTLSIMEFASVDIAFVMVRGKDLIDPLMVILLYAVFNIVTALIATPVGKMTDKFGKQRIIVIGLVILLVVSCVLAFPIEKLGWAWLIAVIIFPLFGIYQAIVDTGSKAFVSDITGKNKKGKIYGLYYFLVGALSIPESLLFAYLYQTFGYMVAFSFSTLLLFICIIIFARADFTQKKSQGAV